MIVKVTLVFAIALVTALCMRRAAAATRHAVLAGAQTAVLLLPVLTNIVPTVSVGELPVTSCQSCVAIGQPLAQPATGNRPPVTIPWRHLWLSGFLLVAGVKLVSLTRAVLLVRRARVLRDGIRVSDEVDQPMTFGSTIVLPRDAAGSAAVLLHERAHVARHDTLVALLGDLACAVYWFHPLAWLVARRARLERERACDDAVLNAGVAADDYASAIVGVARSSRRAMAMPMAAPSQLEQRITAILDARTPHRASHAGLAAALMLILAPAIAALEPDIARPRLGEPDLTNELPPQSELLPKTPPVVHVAAHFPDGPFLMRMFEAARQAPRDEIDYVPQRARWALAQARDGRLVEPLLESLHDSDWRVRAYAAWALGYSGDTRATAPIVELLDERNWRVRAMAAASLANLADPAAEDAMLRAVDDPAWQVRSQVAAYLGRRGTHREVLRALRDDRHLAVRTFAEEGLR
jgi:beta-lactamase regulating signal transducer with metallopeptidase domain